MAAQVRALEKKLDEERQTSQAALEVKDAALEREKRLKEENALLREQLEDASTVTSSLLVCRQKRLEHRFNALKQKLRRAEKRRNSTGAGLSQVLDYMPPLGGDGTTVITNTELIVGLNGTIADPNEGDNAKKRRTAPRQMRNLAVDESVLQFAGCYKVRGKPGGLELNDQWVLCNLYTVWTDAYGDHVYQGHLHCHSKRACARCENCLCSIHSAKRLRLAQICGNRQPHQCVWHCEQGGDDPSHMRELPGPGSICRGHVRALRQVRRVALLHRQLRVQREPYARGAGHLDRCRRRRT